MSHSTLSPSIVVPSGPLSVLASCIDHTLLEPDVTGAQIERHCAEALEHGFACVFVNPCWAALSAHLLHGSSVRVGVPIAFPLGASTTSTKRIEAEEALRLGATEIDMVLNIGALRSGDRNLVEQDIRGVSEVVHSGGGLLKVILETALLTLDEKLVACQLAMAAGADYVKTSTGFGPGGATADDVALMRGVVGDKLGVKASGGIRTAADALAMLQAGASRIGTSAGVSILQGLSSPSHISSSRGY
ncbi:MAG: deoxyribose-phosphate aldolase [Acidobacteriales bacterium]|nr:deoxyribose-phosphate aldolase [Terriglobales bacterium]